MDGGGKGSLPAWLCLFRPSIVTRIFVPYHGTGQGLLVFFPRLVVMDRLDSDVCIVLVLCWSRICLPEKAALDTPKGSAQRRVFNLCEANRTQKPKSKKNGRGVLKPNRGGCCSFFGNMVCHEDKVG